MDNDFRYERGEFSAIDVGFHSIAAEAEDSFERDGLDIFYSFHVSFLCAEPFDAGGVRAFRFTTSRREVPEAVAEKDFIYTFSRGEVPGQFFGKTMVLGVV